MAEGRVASPRWKQPRLAPQHPRASARGRLAVRIARGSAQE